MIPVPQGKPRDIIAFANELIEQCSVSIGVRSDCYRLLNAVAETGRPQGDKSLINLMYTHLKRTAANLYSPIELQFAIDFERPRTKIDIERGHTVAKTLTRTWERNGTDETFGDGVFEALKYGAAIHKQWVQSEGSDEHPVYYDKLVMPWNFGVYREDENRLDRQEVLYECSTLTRPEVWGRIYHMPGADKLLGDIMQHARGGEASGEPTNFFHQILSTSQISTTPGTRPGGVLQLDANPNYPIMGPVVAAEVVKFHELWVKDETDWTTIQMVEPDVLVAPRFKKSNLLGVGNEQPYRLIQPNRVTNWFWGRSELIDLIEPQGLLSTWADDVKRLFGLQVDKLLGFIGDTNMTDELYAQFRMAGYANLGQGAEVKDLTPTLPAEGIPMLKFVIEIINMIGQFPEILQGKGEQGVRAGVHASTLLKTGAITLLDRSLRVERQCAGAADLTLQIMEAKDPEHYWTKADTTDDMEKTKFLLSDLPPDWRVTVNEHSSSPVFADAQAQLIFQAAKLGYVTGEYVLDNMPFPNKEMAKAQLKEKEKKQSEFMQGIMKNNPEVADKLLLKQVGGGKK